MSQMRRGLTPDGKATDPQGTKIPTSIDIKFDECNYVGNVTPHAKFGAHAPTGSGLHIHEFVDPRV